MADRRAPFFSLLLSPVMAQCFSLMFSPQNLTVSRPPLLLGRRVLWCKERRRPLASVVVCADRDNDGDFTDDCSIKPTNGPERVFVAAVVVTLVVWSSVCVVRLEQVSNKQRPWSNFARNVRPAEAGQWNALAAGATCCVRPQRARSERKASDAYQWRSMEQRGSSESRSAC